MQLYLSSYRLGNNPEDLVTYFTYTKKIAVIGNAMDYASGSLRQEKMTERSQALTARGLQPEEVDLREYFDNPQALKHRLNQFVGVWVRGGNTFILRRAMAQSGMDTYLESKVKDKSFIYGGDSAGICILGPSLHGLEFFDEPDVVPAGYEKEVIWDGLAILDYLIVPHYKSEKNGGEMVDKTVEYLVRNNVAHKTLRDGEVIVGETN